MNNTNPLYQELVARMRAKELESEIRQARLENEALRAASTDAGWVAHRIAHFAEWMVVTGESLQERYDHASMHDCSSQTKALAH